MMLKKLINKEVIIGMMVFRPYQLGDLNTIRYYKGTIIDCDDSFIMFSDGFVLNIRYIYSIEVK